MMIHTRFHWLRVLLFALVSIFGANTPTQTVFAQDDTAPAMESHRWVVIFVGIPGDAEHEALFARTTETWSKWFSTKLDVAPERLRIIPTQAATDGGGTAEKPTPLTKDGLESSLRDMKQAVKPDDSVWILFLGHGNHEGTKAWFHVSGRDPTSDDVGRWLSDLRCREQFIWFTQSSSGWFLRPASREKRIVITATAADQEANETEFPYAFTTVCEMELEKLDRDQDGRVSVAELFVAIVQETERRFREDNRLATEHAQLDDNGDGRGTENLFPEEENKRDENQRDEANEDKVKLAAPLGKRDGELAKSTYLK